MAVVIRDEPVDGEAAQRLLAAFAAEIAGLYPGWTPATGPSAEPADFQPPGGRFLVAYVDDEPAACAGLKRLNSDAGEIKRVYVRPDMRRRGLARRLLEELEAAAQTAGYHVVRLDTGAHQPEAILLFQAAGYRPIADYNGNPYARYWFEKALEPLPNR